MLFANSDLLIQSLTDPVSFLTKCLQLIQQSAIFPMDTTFCRVHHGRIKQKAHISGIFRAQSNIYDGDFLPR